MVMAEGISKGVKMLFITTDKIKYSTVGASFTVTFSVAPDEIGYLYALHEKYMEVNMSGFKLPESILQEGEN